MEINHAINILDLKHGIEGDIKKFNEAKHKSRELQKSKDHMINSVRSGVDLTGQLTTFDEKIQDAFEVKNKIGDMLKNYLNDIECIIPSFYDYKEESSKWYKGLSNNLKVDIAKIQVEIRKEESLIEQDLNEIDSSISTFKTGYEMQQKLRDIDNKLGRIKKRRKSLKERNGLILEKKNLKINLVKRESLVKKRKVLTTLLDSLNYKREHLLEQKEDAENNIKEISSFDKYMFINLKNKIQKTLSHREETDSIELIMLPNNLPIPTNKGQGVIVKEHKKTEMESVSKIYPKEDNNHIEYLESSEMKQLEYDLNVEEKKLKEIDTFLRDNPRNRFELSRRGISESKINELKNRLKK